MWTQKSFVTEAGAAVTAATQMISTELVWRFNWFGIDRHRAFEEQLVRCPVDGIVWRCRKSVES